MAICTDCKIEINKQNSYKKAENNLNSRCKRCFNKYCAERWKKRKQIIIEERGGVCFDCKCSFHYSVFEFHHLDPLQKEFNWSRARKLTENKMRKEVEKCVMLCANCHRLRHWKVDKEI